MMLAPIAAIAPEIAAPTSLAAVLGPFAPLASIALALGFAVLAIRLCGERSEAVLPSVVDPAEALRPAA